MNRADAKRIAETITNEQIATMFDRAKNEISDWTEVSIVNKGMTKGVAWNILANDFDVNKTYHNLAKVNMVREFGKFLSEDMKLVRKIKIKPIVHQEPKFRV